MTCPVDPKARRAYHEALVALPLPQWLKLAYVGQQLVPDDGDDPGYVLDLRNCTCGNTMGRRV